MIKIEKLYNRPQYELITQEQLEAKIQKMRASTISLHPYIITSCDTISEDVRNESNPLMIEEFNRHLGEFYSRAQFPCSAIFVHGEHYVLLYFQDRKRLTIYDTSTLPKSIESYGDLGSWCQEHSVVTSFAKIYKQLPGSTDCGPLSIANAIFLSRQSQITEQSMIDPESIANFMGSLDINRLQQVNSNYPPGIIERALQLVGEISQWMQDDEQREHYPSNEQFLHP